MKIWDTNTGTLTRELSQPAEAVWRVAFESEKCVLMACRGGRTIMEVWDFSPPEDHEVNEAERRGDLQETEQELDMMDADEDEAAKESMMDAYDQSGDDSDDMTD